MNNKTNSFKIPDSYFEGWESIGASPTDVTMIVNIEKIRSALNIAILKNKRLIRWKALQKAKTFS